MNKIEILSGNICKVVIDNLDFVIKSIPPIIYIFNTPSTTWTIPHNLNRKVIIQLYTPGGVEMEGHIIHLNDNTAQVNFSAPTIGYALIL